MCKLHRIRKVLILLRRSNIYTLVQRCNHLAEKGTKLQKNAFFDLLKRHPSLLHVEELLVDLTILCNQKTGEKACRHKQVGKVMLLCRYAFMGHGLSNSASASSPLARPPKRRDMREAGGDDEGEAEEEKRADKP